MSKTISVDIKYYDNNFRYNYCNDGWGWFIDIDDNIINNNNNSIMIINNYEFLNDSDTNSSFSSISTNGSNKYSYCSIVAAIFIISMIYILRF